MKIYATVHLSIASMHMDTQDYKDDDDNVGSAEILASIIIQEKYHP